MCVSQCSSECGNGTQSRGVVCIVQNNGQLEVTSDDRCSHLPRPPSGQTCYLKSCGAQWYMTEWSSVSSSHTQCSYNQAVSINLFNKNAFTYFSVLVLVTEAFEWGRFVVCKTIWPWAMTVILLLNLQIKRSVTHIPAHHRLVWFSSAVPFFI